MTTVKTLLVLTLGLAPAVAFAATCTTDADCAPDEVCVAVPCACAAPACDPDGGACPEPEPCTCDAAAECMPADSFDDDVYYSGDCETDADCPMGFACEEVQVPCASTWVDCACPGCAEGEECPPCDCSGEQPVEPPECEVETYRYCAYKPVECAADADCPDGFACKAMEVCTASGGCGCAVPACDPEGECPEPEPCECDDSAYEESCEVVGNYCEARQIECEAAADCPAGWECVGIGADCACPAIACAEDDPEGCPEFPPCDCATEPTISYCMPGGWAEAAARDYAAGGAANDAVGEEQSPTAAFMENASKAAAEADADGTGGDDGEGGCSYGTTAKAGLGALLLTLLALLGVAVRRAAPTSR